jgi:tryptophan synthase alpha chain
MNSIAAYIDRLNRNNRKALSVFLTAGYPHANDFVGLALDVLEKGADMLEIGIPFSDPIADGPVIQYASQKALASGITIDRIFSYVEDIRKFSDKPVILMGYANPILHYGIEPFLRASRNSGVNGVIVPDIPLEEYASFWGPSPDHIEIIQLTTPTSPEARIKAIDQRSRGFVYCVSVAGTTGVKNKFDEYTMAHVKRTYRLLKKNKMLIGFGISGAKDVERFATCCDGVIVGSAVLKCLENGRDEREFSSALNLVSELSRACQLT